MQTIEKLLKAGIDPNIHASNDKISLHHAIDNLLPEPALEAVKLLVQYGADINEPYGKSVISSGKTPLSYARSNNKNAIADYLHSLGAKP